MSSAGAEPVVDAIDLEQVEEGRAVPERRVLDRLEKTAIGKRQADWITTVHRREPAGCLLYGPYWQLPAGAYRLNFRCRSGKPRMPGQPVLGVEVIAMNRVQLAWLDLTAEELQAETGSLDFSVPPQLGLGAGDEARLEFRFFHLGNADLAITAVDLRGLGAEAVRPSPVRRWRMLGRLERTAIGKRTRNGIAVRRAKSAGCVLDGGRPFLQLPRGCYRLCFKCVADIPRMASEPVLGVEVVTRRRWQEGRSWGWHSLLGLPARGGLQQAWRDFTATQLSSGSGSIDFAVPAELSLEGGQEVLFGFRFLHLGNAGLTITAVNLQRMADEARDDFGAAALQSPAVLTGKTNVVVIGNCQALTVYEALVRTRAFNARLDARYHFVNLQQHLRELGKSDLKNCDILFVQDIRDWENYPLRSEIPEELPVVKFPLLHFASLWPFDHYNGPGDREAYERESPNLTFLYLDGLLAKLRKEIPDREQRLLAYRSLSIAGVVNYVRLHDFEKRRLAAMDKQFGFDIGQYILDNFQRKRLFYTTNHPNGQILAMLLQHLLTRVGIASVYRSITSLDHLRRLQVPVHPKVAKALGVKWASEDTKYLYGGERITWETYVRRYIEHYG
jgi:Polysaccharide biosynthesis enzyme WcbI